MIEMMTAEELKNSILHLALQGRLVSQEREEGTGNELLSRILNEKNRLIKDGYLKRDNITAEDEPPFDIPETWAWARLNDLVSKNIKRGKSPKYVSKSRTLVFAQKCNTKKGNIDLSLCLYLDESKLPNYPAEEFMMDKDIVINSTGNGTLGRVGFYRDSDNPMKLSIVPDSHVTVIRPNKFMFTEFMLWGLKYYQPYLEKLGTGSTNQTELGAKTLKALFFPVPPLAEQKRIVAKIEELMPYVDQYAIASTKLNVLNTTFPDQMKKSILQQAVQGKLVPQDPSDEPASVLLEKIAEEKLKLIKEGKIKKQKPLASITENEVPFEIPESWKWARLGSLLTDTEAGKSPQCKNRPANKEEWGVIKTTAIQDGFFVKEENKVLPSEFEIKRNQIIHQGDLLITRAGPQNRTGITCVVEEKIDNLILSDKTVRLKYIEGLVNPFYLMFALKSPKIQRYITGAKSGMAASQVNISQDKMKQFLIPIPPFKEQQRIVDRLDDVLPVIINCQTMIQME